MKLFLKNPKSKAMIYKTILTFLLSLTLVNGFTEDTISEVSAHGTIRYDFEFVGAKDTFFIVPVQIKRLKSNVGSQSNIQEDHDMGNIRFRIIDKNSDKLLYQKGFSPLFFEWLATAEAKTTSRSYYHGLFFPDFGNDFIVEIDKRDHRNNWMKLYADTVLQQNIWIKKELPVIYPVDTICFSGNASEKIDIAILAEGYTGEEMSKFVSDVCRMTDSLFSYKPYSSYKNRFNIYAVKVPSVESGTDQPDKDIYRNTVFNSTFDTFESERYLTTSDMKSIYDAVDGVAWDHIIVLVNSSRYGGGGFYNSVSVCSSDEPRSPLVFIHEFGHAFAGLGDEYYYADNTEEPIYYTGVEPWEPNLTTLTHFENKWKDMISANVPVPTPRDSVYAGKVGVFEGGGYLSKGVYSPAMNCLMKELNARIFCPVCQEAIERAILNGSR